MEGLTAILNILALINGATPGIVSLIATIREPNGETVEISLDKAEDGFDDLLKRIGEAEVARPIVDHRPGH